jgi:hypothetical protein
LGINDMWQVICGKWYVPCRSNNWKAKLCRAAHRSVSDSEQRELMKQLRPDAIFVRGREVMAIRNL